MLAEQHCVCTKSGLKNVFSTRCVVGRQRERGRRTFFLKMALEHSKSQHPAPFRNIISDSFWECWECRSLSCCPLNPAEKTSDSQGQPVPEHGVRHQKDHSKNMQRRGADACWLPSQHTPNWILEGVQEFATAILIQKKKKKLRKCVHFLLKRLKGFFQWREPHPNHCLSCDLSLTFQNLLLHLQNIRLNSSLLVKYIQSLRALHKRAVT